VQVDEPTRKKFAMTKDAGYAAFGDCWHGRRMDTLAAPNNLGHAAEQLGRRNRCVFLGQRVPLGDEPCVSRGVDGTDHTMGKESAFAEIQHDIVRNDANEGAVLDNQSVARPDGGKHTVAGDTQTERPEGTQDFGSDLTLDRVLLAMAKGFARAEDHDTFRLRRQPLCVA